MSHLEHCVLLELLTDTKNLKLTKHWTYRITHKTDVGQWWWDDDGQVRNTTHTKSQCLETWTTLHQVIKLSGLLHQTLPSHALFLIAVRIWQSAQKMVPKTTTRADAREDVCVWVCSSAARSTAGFSLYLYLILKQIKHTSSQRAIKAHLLLMRIRPQGWTQPLTWHQISDVREMDFCLHVEDHSDRYEHLQQHYQQIYTDSDGKHRQT